MKKPKMLKYPRKPKANASTAAMENYLNKVKEVDKENDRRKRTYLSETKKKASLKQRVAKVGKPKGF